MFNATDHVRDELRKMLFSDLLLEHKESDMLQAWKAETTRIEKTATKTNRSTERTLLEKASEQNREDPSADYPTRESIVHNPEPSRCLEKCCGQSLQRWASRRLKPNTFFDPS
jgi:hypothetical protein